MSFQFQVLDFGFQEDYILGSPSSVCDLVFLRVVFNFGKKGGNERVLCKRVSCTSQPEPTATCTSRAAYVR